MKKENQRLFAIISERGDMQSNRNLLMIEALRLLESGVESNIERRGTALHAAVNSPDAKMVTLLLASDIKEDLGIAADKAKERHEYQAIS
jgi:hypothetical protein